MVDWREATTISLFPIIYNLMEVGFGTKNLWAFYKNCDTVKQLGLMNCYRLLIHTQKITGVVTSVSVL